MRRESSLVNTSKVHVCHAYCFPAQVYYIVICCKSNSLPSRKSRHLISLEMHIVGIRWQCNRFVSSMVFSHIAKLRYIVRRYKCLNIICHCSLIKFGTKSQNCRRLIGFVLIIESTEISGYLRYILEPHWLSMGSRNKQNNPDRQVLIPSQHVIHIRPVLWSVELQCLIR